MLIGKRGRLFKTALFALAWIAALELLTRAFLVSPSNIVPDPLMGYLYAPGSTALVESPDAGFRRASFNEFGLNDWPLERRDHRPRILVLGDSYVEALQVPRAQNLVGILARDRPDLRFINGGRSGLDPLGEYLMLEKLAPAVTPATVIMVLNQGDMTDLLHDRLTLRRCGSVICDYHMPPLPGPARGPFAHLVRGSSGLLTFLVRRYQDPLRAELATMELRLPRFSTALAAPPRHDSYSANDFEAVLALVFRRISRRYKLIVVAIPDTAFQSGGRSAVPDGGRFEAAVRQAAGSAGADYFDAAPALMRIYAQTGQPPRGFAFNRPGFGHLDAAGHAAVAHGIEPCLHGPDQKVAG